MNIEVKWKTWWEINKWRFTWTPQRTAVTTGEGGDAHKYIVDFLVECLEHKNFDVRGSASLALGRAGSKSLPTAIPHLEKLTEDDHPVPSGAAVLSLGMLGSKASVPLITEILKDRKADTYLRTYACVSLGLIGDSSSSRAMMDLLVKRSEEEEVRAACMMGLALMKDERAGLTFVNIMTNRQEKEELRAMAATALGKLGKTELRKGRGKLDVVQELVKILATEKKKRKIQMSAIMAVSALGPSEKITEKKLVDVLGRIFTQERNADVKSFIMMGIAELAREGKAQEKARSLFRNVLRGESNQSLLAFACIAAGLSQDRESIQHIRNIFKKTSNPSLRSAAAVGLGILKDLESTQMFVEEISGKGSPEVKGYCCIAIGLMGSRDNQEALPTLRTILKEGNVPQLRAAAAMALTLLGEANAVDTLIKAVEEGNTYIRMSIIMAVGYFRDMRTVKPLIDLFKTDKGMNDEVRAIILTALGYILEEAEKPILKKLATHYNYHLKKFGALLQIVKLL